MQKKSQKNQINLFNWRNINHNQNAKKNHLFFLDHRGKWRKPPKTSNDDGDHDIDFGSWDHHPSLDEKKSEDIND